MGKLIGLSGPKGSGKDSVADMILDKHDDYRKVAFADKIREMLRIVNPIVSDNGRTYNDVVHELGYDRAKVEYPEIRRLLRVIGTEWGRNTVAMNFWVDLLRSELPTKPGESAVVADVRLPNEAKMVRDLGGFLVLVVRPKNIDHADTHESEMHWRTLRPDYVIVNDGSLDDLSDRTVELLDYIVS